MSGSFLLFSNHLLEFRTDYSFSQLCNEVSPFPKFPSWHLNNCWLWIKSLKTRVPTCSIFINNGKEDAKCPVVARKSSRNLHSHSTPPDFLHFSPYFSHLQLGFLLSTICISSWLPSRICAHQVFVSTNTAICDRPLISRSHSLAFVH